MVEEGAACGVEPLVSEVVVSILDKRETPLDRDEKLVPTLLLPSPEPTIEDEESSCQSKESR